ncbi:GIY-YIG nuclease family protein [Schnuerera sp.]|uniref:GIY-YIG nuclease family protein n=1 Tax=Schnuerera sp. TaxID=2794844 RepID=UPI002B7CF755|nr:GIY-YIG nuclease family protein [Schnuerera sp.]HSH35485.1 GIY-YIG nuclease family protein [Schnuerera sp.]
MKIVGIYKITNLIDGKVYIGQTVNYNKRKKRHLSSLKNGNHHNEHLQRAFDKHGEDSFKIELIKKCNIEELDKLERYYIKELDACNHDKGYNMMYGGQRYRNFTKEVRLKMSEAGKGRKFTDEHKKKIGLAHKGRKLSQEHIIKISATKKKTKIHCGEKNPNALISDSVAKKIIMDLLANMAVKDIANKYQVSSDVVYNIMHNKSYSHIMPDVREELKNRTSVLQDEKIETAINLYLQGHSQNEISKTLNISRNTLRKELKARNINPQIHVNQYIKQANTEVIS